MKMKGFRDKIKRLIGTYPVGFCTEPPIFTFKNRFLMIAPQKLTPQQALPKLLQYCSYQERCHHEVLEKLNGYGIWGDDADEIVGKLIQDNYLNEERFACHFAGGRFRVKQWGRTKIKYELKLRKVSEYCIKKAMKEIEEDDYLKTLDKLAQLKWKSLAREKNSFIKKKKLRDHLQQKGYESDLITDWLKTA